MELVSEAAVLNGKSEWSDKLCCREYRIAPLVLPDRFGYD